jgi:hypothetical protein
MNYILESVKRVVDKSKLVKINQVNLKRFAGDYAAEKLTWEDFLPFKPMPLNEKEKLAFSIIYCSQNFCFWGEPKWEINYQEKKISGAYGIMACLHRAIEEGFDILNPSFLETISKSDLETVLRGNTRIPLFDERLNILKEIGRVTNKKYRGDFTKIVDPAGMDALKFIKRLSRDFPSYGDSSEYSRKKVYFYKRAQLLVHDLYMLFNGKNYGAFTNISELTAFVDYKIPAVLRKLGILEYAPELAQKVDNYVLIPKGSVEEIEIRANALWAVELIKRIVMKRANIISADIDMFLWLEGKKKSELDKPHHRTSTIAY